MGCQNSKPAEPPTEKPATDTPANNTESAPNATSEAAKVNDVENMKQISKEAFQAAIKKVLILAIDGYPKALRSVISKRNELLRETVGDQDQAAEKVKEAAANMKEEGKTWLMGLIPYIGLPATVLYPTWTLMRRICLLAAVYGLDMKSDDTHGRILYVFAGLRAVPAAEFALETAVQVVWTTFAGPVAGLMPVGMLVSKVANVEGVVTAQIGKEKFSEKRRQVTALEYSEILDLEPTYNDYMELAKEGTALALYTAWRGTQSVGETLKDKDKRNEALGKAVDTGKSVAQTVGTGTVAAVNMAKEQGPKLASQAVDKAKQAGQQAVDKAKQSSSQ